MSFLSSFLNSNTLILLSSLVGIVLGLQDLPSVNLLAQETSNIFMGLLKMISLPVIFLSIVATVGGMSDSQSLKQVGRKTLFYTLLTTFLSAVVALCLYLFADPAASVRAQTFAHLNSNGVGESVNSGSYWSFLLKSIPTNIVQPFLEHNVMGVLFLAVFISFAMLAMPTKEKTATSKLVKELFQITLQLARFVMALIPLAVAAFVILFIKDLNSGLDLRSLFLYIACIVGANLVQAAIVLPILLISKGISPLKLLRGMWPALTVAFFSKSSAASLSSVLECAEKKVGIRKDISRFCFPLCTTINMNACAGFILITVLFVSTVHGAQHSHLELVSWLFIATIAALGNAAVPMGCFFLASSFLASQNVPLNIMGAILPVYSILDMLETAINIWSDACVTAIVDKETRVHTAANPVVVSSQGSLQVETSSPAPVEKA